MTSQETTQSTQAPSSKSVIFWRRLVTSIILWSVILAALFSSNRVLSDYFFMLVMMILAGMGLQEFYGLAAKRNYVCFNAWGIFGGICLMISTYGYLRLKAVEAPGKINDFETAVLICFVLGLCVRQFFSRSNAQGMQAIATTLLGLMYVPWLLNFIQKINFFPQIDGRYYVVYFILVTKFSDTGAYVIGSLFGKHKMIPRISPGKTWEGFVGAIVTSTSASLIYVHFLHAHLAGMNYFHATFLGILLSVTAVVGDLIESIFKREAGVKDSGQWFPGMGGILDLLDSLLFNAPLMYLYLRHILT
jgi:phosphatidate cytidylyltransferase